LFHTENETPNLKWNVGVPAMRERDIGRPRTYPETPKRFRILYVDPPWEFKDKITGGILASGKRSANSQYLCMSLEDLCALPVKDIAARNSMLFLWTPNSHVKKAIQVVESDSWGFKYKTNVAWTKDKISFGWYVRTTACGALPGVRKTHGHPER